MLSFIDYHYTVKKKKEKKRKEQSRFFQFIYSYYLIYTCNLFHITNNIKTIM